MSAAELKAVYWSLALANMALLVAIAAAGVHAIRAGAVGRHARRMRTAAALVGVFLVSYAGKLGWLGRERLEEWEPLYVHVLRLHELCIAAMLLAGAVAMRQALRHRFATAVAPDPRAVRIHRAAGWTALAAALLGVATAAMVLAGMFGRLE